MALQIVVCVNYFTDEGGSTMLSKVRDDLGVVPLVGDWVELTPATEEFSEWHLQVGSRYVGGGRVEIHCPTHNNRLDANAVEKLRANGYRRPGERTEEAS